ncbi:MAG: CerR family C-terminal domain-containing protein [Desulfobulbaceae bacterium]|nr:CerR family C-terminal domain-containing protein [Desulfobulbaceae bacterium]
MNASGNEKNKERPAKRISTKERLLQAGGEVFARYGFRGATVRRIVRRAHANVASVSYYFGDKQGLYAAVLQYTFSSAKEKYPPDLGLQQGAGGRERLHAFIRSFLLRILDDGRPAWHGKLMVQEMADPTPALDSIVEEAIRPLYRQLALIVHELAGDSASNQSVHLCCLSIMGQCVFYLHARPVVTRLQKREPGPADVEELAQHITRFSLLAVAGMADGRAVDAEQKS